MEFIDRVWGSRIGLQERAAFNRFLEASLADGVLDGRRSGRKAACVGRTGEIDDSFPKLERDVSWDVRGICRVEGTAPWLSLFDLEALVVVFV